MYDLALFLLTVCAALNRAAFPFAAVLASAWAAAFVLEGQGAWAWLPWIDTLTIYPLVYLATRALKWWTIAVVGLCFAAVLSHALYWSFLQGGIYLGEEYKFALCSAFMASMAVLVIGGYDVWNRSVRFVRSLSGSFGRAPRFGMARLRAEKGLSKERASQ